jgi:aminobenzoyl-glutamate transport protein
MAKKSFFDKFISFVQKSADKLPEPMFLFAFLAVFVLVLSAVVAAFDVSVVHPGTGEQVYSENLLSMKWLQRVFTDAVKNFAGFPPLGLVLATMLGVGVAERSGFFATLLKKFIRIIPPRFLTAALVFASINSSLIADAGFVIMPAMGAIVFFSAGRNPLAGIAASYAGICGGFSANLLVTALDPLLSGFAQPAAQMIDQAYEVYPTANYYFMIASVFLVTIVCTFVNDKIVEPRLGKLKIQEGSSAVGIDDDHIENENRALAYALLSFVAVASVLVLLAAPEDAFFRDDAQTLKPFFKSIVTVIIILLFVPSLVFGIVAKKIRRSRDLAKMLSESMSTMGAYIVLAFFAAQFVAYFTWSNLGIITAVKGAEFLNWVGLSGIPLLLAFLLFSSIMNIFVYSASAKWAVLAPVFIPMLMLMGYSPETTQVIYRVGDSITNMITPLLPYLPIVIAFGKKYDKNYSYGALLSTVVPYSLALLVIWGIFLLLWIGLEIPLGPSANIFYP